MFVAAAVFLAAFLYTESHVKEPIISLDLFKNSIFPSCQCSAFPDWCRFVRRCAIHTSLYSGYPVIAPQAAEADRQ